jgi:hypothetical protein
MPIEEIGCCGAYCGTCRAYHEACRGCKIGYDNGERDIQKARCRIKVCCVTRKHPSCADCPEFADCPTLGEFHAKKGYKYGKYRQALEYIRANGYKAFLTVADGWTGACGKYPPKTEERKRT